LAEELRVAHGGYKTPFYSLRTPLQATIIIVGQLYGDSKRGRDVVHIRNYQANLPSVRKRDLSVLKSLRW